MFGWTSASRPATIGSSTRPTAWPKISHHSSRASSRPSGRNSSTTHPASRSAAAAFLIASRDSAVTGTVPSSSKTPTRVPFGTEASGVNGTGCPFGSPMSGPAITATIVSDVVHRSRHRPDDAGEREGTGAGREVSGGRHAARRRLEAADAAEVRGHANRSAAVAADAAGREARGDGRRFAAARSSRRAIERPRVVRPAVERVVRLPRHELLGSVRHADHDGARGLESCDQRCVGVADDALAKAAAGLPWESLHGDRALDADRHSAQGTQVPSDE